MNDHHLPSIWWQSQHNQNEPSTKSKIIRKSLNVAGMATRNPATAERNPNQEEKRLHQWIPSWSAIMKAGEGNRQGETLSHWTPDLGTPKKNNNALKRTRRKAANEDIQLKFYLKSRFPHSQGKNGGTGRTEHDKPPKKKNQDLQESQPMEEKKHVKRKRSVKERMN